MNFLQVINSRLGSKDVRMAKIKNYINVVFILIFMIAPLLLKE